jgi:hypothetical protein
MLQSARRSCPPLSAFAERGQGVRTGVYDAGGGHPSLGGRVDSGQFQCPECSQTFETQDELDQHTEQVHLAPVSDDETPISSEDEGARPEV